MLQCSGTDVPFYRGKGLKEKVMTFEVFRGLMIPFVGTTAGAARVFFLRNQIGEKLQKILTGFAAGVMVAASFWSLLAPALEQSAHLGKLAFMPAATGFLVGVKVRKAASRRQQSLFWQ